MSTHKHIDRICVAVLLCTLVLTVLFMNGERLGLRPMVDEDAAPYDDSTWFTANDLRGDWDPAGATVIRLAGDTAHVTGQGAYFYEGDVMITNGGYYVVSGSLSGGSIIVDAYNSSKVWVRLEGAEIDCPDDACLQVLQAEKVFLTLADGTENRFSSGADFSDEALAAGRDGAIFASDDLTINGSGSLAVTARYRHGIEANDDLRITGGTISIQAAGDAVNVNDSLGICNADLSISAQDDGLVVKSPEGYCYLESGNLDITCADDGIHAAGEVTLAGGNVTIQAGDDGIHGDSLITVLDGTLQIGGCYEGLEARRVDLQGGSVAVYPTDDGISASAGQFATEAGSEIWIHISGGDLLIVNEAAEGADGLDSKGDISITGGDIRISLSGSGASNAIHYTGTAGIHGGTLVACGRRNHAQGFGAGSTQCSVLYNLPGSADGPVRLTDLDGGALVSYDPPGGFSSVLISCPSMVQDASYRLALGDDVAEITLEEISSTFGIESDESDIQVSVTAPQPSPTAAETAADPEEVQAETPEHTVEYTAEIWLWLGASALVLLAGLAVTFLFRRH